MNKKTVKLLNILKFGTTATRNIGMLARALLWVNVITSVIFFWYIVFTFYEPYQAIAVTMLKFVRLSIFMFAGAFIFHYFCSFVHELVYNKAIKKYNVEVK